MTIPIENPNQINILVSSSVSILIAAISVGLRLLAKRIGRGLDHSDCCIVVALVRQSWLVHIFLRLGTNSLADV
jgi:hypothetical protein